jgi:lipopolysaccharide/colanic/teichoic acid biosynthesis glycosyltransferase
VIPGITGLWQVSGRNNTTYEERVAYDEHYVHNWSIWLDLYILVRTIKTVITAEGAY